LTTMYQLLIVDDQPDLVDDLSEMLPWSSIGIGSVYKAYSAQEALETIAANTIDIVITDIRMPGMSGLDLIERIRVSWKKIRCILLTGFDDFEYAKRAIQNQANDYLLKPAEDEELLNAVSRAVKDIEEEWHQISSYQNALHSIKNNLPTLRNHLLSDLLEGRRITPQELQDKLALFDISIQSGEPFSLMMLRLEEYFDQYASTDISLIDYAISNMAEEIFSDGFFIWQTKDMHDYLIFLIQYKHSHYVMEPKQQIEMKAAQLQHYVKLYLKGTVSVLVSPMGAFPKDISALYETSVIQFRQHIGSERGFLLSIGEDTADQQTEAVHLFTHLYDPPTLVHLLEAGQWSSLETKLDAIFDELEHKFDHSHERILETYFTIMSAFSSSIHKSKRLMADIMGDDFQKLLSGSSFHTIQQLREWTFKLFNKYKNEIDIETKDSRSSLVRQVQEFVHEHLEEASLQSIAAHVYLNPSYLSKIYKLETGEGISDFLFRLKMEQATHKLRSTNEKIYEIAAGLGYLKTSYFIKLFKEKYGITPQEYRDKLS
jgi:two-component system response regulator YesN